MESSTEEWRSSDEDSIGRFFVRDTWPPPEHVRGMARREERHYILESEASFRSQCTVAWHVCAYGITASTSTIEEKRREEKEEDRSNVRSFDRREWGEQSR